MPRGRLCTLPATVRISTLYADASAAAACRAPDVANSRQRLRAVANNCRTDFITPPVRSGRILVGGPILSGVRTHGAACSFRRTCLFAEIAAHVTGNLGLLT